MSKLSFLTHKCIEITAAFMAVTTPAHAAVQNVSPNPQIELEDEVDDDYLSAEDKKWLNSLPRDKDGNIIQPLPHSAPQTDTNRQFENEALSYLKKAQPDKVRTCLTLFPNRDALRFYDLDGELSTFSPNDENCYRSYISYSNENKVMGGLYTATRERYHEFASNRGLTLDDDALDLFVAAHEFYHAVSFPNTNVNVDEQKADIFAALVLQSRNTPGAEDVITFFDNWRTAQMTKDPSHKRSFSLPRNTMLPKNDIETLLKATETLHSSVSLASTPMPIIKATHKK